MNVEQQAPVRVQLKVDVAPELRRSVKLAAAERGESVRALVERLLVDEMKERKRS